MATLSQRVLWTALPRGRFEDGALHVVAFIAPQLSTDAGEGRLGEWADWADWPATLEGIRFGLQFLSAADDTLRTASNVTVITPEPPADISRSRLWTALFPDSTLVRSFAPAPAWLGDAVMAST